MKLLILIPVVLVLSPATVSAQELRQLTLQEAMSIARINNPNTLSALASVDIAELDVRARYGVFLPNVTASMGWNGSSRTQLTGSDNFGRTVVLPAPATFKNSSASQGINTSVQLFDGFRNVNQLKAARSGVEAAHAGVDIQYLQLEADVAQRFYDALRFDRLVEVERELLASAEERLDANERLFRVAAATQVDVLGAQVDVTRQDLALGRQLGEARKARLRVLESMGILDQINDFTPIGTFPEIFDPAALEVGTLLETAMRINPGVQQRQAEYVSAGFGARAALGSWLPTVSLNGGWGRGLNEQQFGAFFNFNPGQDRFYSFSMNLQWPIFNGFQRSQQIGQANAQQRQASESLRLVTLQLEQQVRAAYIDLENRYDGFQSQQRSAGLSRTRVELAREQYLTGAISFTILQQIIGTAATEERGLVDAEYNFALAIVTMEQLIGQPVVER